jgi:hypothetical protein
LVQEKPDSVVMRIVPEIKTASGGKYRVHRSLVRSIYKNPRDREWLGPS